MNTQKTDDGGTTTNWPTLTVVFDDRQMDVFFTHPEKITMSLLTRMQQLIRRKLKEHQAQAFANMRKELSIPPPVMAVAPEGVSKIETSPPPTDDAVLNELIDEAT